MKVDYLIVGQGIAGSVMALTLSARGKSVAILNDPQLSSSSAIAAGVYNPFNFRRSIPTWQATNTIDAAKKFYTDAERTTGTKFHQDKKIIRVFDSDQERTEWESYVQQDDHLFAGEIHLDQSFENILSPYGFGILDGGGMVNTSLFLDETWAYFYNRGYYLQEKCNFSLVKSEGNTISYDDRVVARHMICCEGHLARNNPFFDSRLIAPTKGELLHVKIPGLNLREIAHGPVYLAPISDGTYVCGATFNPTESDEELTEEGKTEVLLKLQKMTSLPCEVVKHFAGVRPAGRDRKPVLGRSRNHPNLSIFNGFGSRAVLLAPFLAQMLADHLENDAEIFPEVNVARFKVY